MAKKTSRARRAKKAARKTKKKPARKAAKKVARRPARARRPQRRRPAARKSTAPKIRPGLISHTEFASTDPLATQSWCQTVLGWKFGEPMETPTGPYRMWRFDNATGGGIRAHNPPESPGTTSYCEVEDIQATYSRALENGATAMFPPTPLPGGMGWTAIVIAPGGVAIGFWSMK